MPPINPSMENLPEEVMVDILSRLPVKTIIHCKCVCNKWHNLVNNSYFIKIHLSRSPAGFMVQHYATILDGILRWLEIEDKLDHHRQHYEPVIDFDMNGYLAAPITFTHLIPVGSVNGLICIWQRDVKVDNIHICNPITREYLTVPRQQNYRDGNGLIVYKFGVSSVTGEYKVLRIFQGDLLGGNLLEAEVYTLGTNQWRSLGQVPYRFGGFDGPFLNGYFHWNFYDQDAPESIFTFDLDKETFQLFPSPPTELQSEAMMEECSEYLGVFKGCLCKSSTFDSRFTIWVMKQYGIKGSWHKELVITQAIGDGLDWSMMRSMYVLGGLQDGSILVVNADQVLAYCPKSETFEDIESLGSWCIVLTHRPSFIKLQNIDSERVHTFEGRCLARVCYL